MIFSDDTVAHAERERLCDLFAQVGPDAPTLCGDWKTNDLAAHLVLRESRPDLAIGIMVPAFAGRLDTAQDKLAATAWPGLIERVRTGPPIWSPTRIPMVDEAVNLIEFVVHHEDVLRGDGQVGPRRTLDDRTAKAVWSGLRRMAGPMFRRSEVGVQLLAPDWGDLTAKKGPDQVIVTGAPLELLLTAYGRGRVAEVSYDGDPAAIKLLQDTKLGLA